MKRRYKMPFGAERRNDGSVRFRLWAPAARRVEICLAGSKKSMRLPLKRCDKGWFELVTDAAKTGTEYRFLIDNAQEVPDPASRFQPRDVHGPSEVVDPAAFDWQDRAWHGRQWEEAVIYELHVGAFTPAGTFSLISESLQWS
jgi:maltooligosyltrehalose trehalohydrolase